MDHQGRLEARRRAGVEGRLRGLVAGLLTERLLVGREALLADKAVEIAEGRLSFQSAAAQAAKEILQ